MTLSNTAHGSTVVGVFEDRERARKAIEALKEGGFTGDAISILAPDKQATQAIAEEVFIERHPVDRRHADGGIGKADETIRVPVREEQASVDKRAVVTEEINVDNRQVQETQAVPVAVRREEARIRQDGDLTLEEDR
jgi:uncharacterized protein (TIGR02271 family)